MNRAVLRALPTESKQHHVQEALPLTTVAPCIPVSVTGHHYTESLLSVIKYSDITVQITELQNFPPSFLSVSILCITYGNYKNHESYKNHPVGDTQEKT